MTEPPTPLDLDAIRATYGKRFESMSNSLYRTVGLLVAEVERLRAKVGRLMGVLEPYTREYPKECNKRVAAENERDAALTEVEHLRAEVARLEEDLSDRTMDLAEMTHPDRPAPAWDEDALASLQALAVHWEAQAAYNADQGGDFWKGMVAKGRECADDLRRRLAVARDHLPVKHDREAVIERLAARWWDLNTGDTDTWESLTPDEREAVVDNGNLAPLADAVLDLWPGESRAEVKAEALREAAEEIDRLYFGPDQDRPFSTGAKHKWGAIQAAKRLRARADRLAAEGGADRG